MRQGWYDLIITFILVDYRKSLIEEIEPVLLRYNWTTDCERFHDNIHDCDGRDALNVLFRDYLYVCPQRAWASGKPQNSWMYFFDEPAPYVPSVYGDPAMRCNEMACTTADLPYLFGLGRLGEHVRLTTPQDELSTIEQAYFSNFIRNGDPNDLSDAPTKILDDLGDIQLDFWPMTQNSSKGYMRFSTASTEYLIPVEDDHHCDFWDEYNEYALH